MTLQELGWNAFFAEAFEPYESDGVIPARVAIRHHGPLVLFGERGELGGLPAGHFADEDLPAVGDWVVARPVEGERKAVVEAVLPRRSAFRRKEAWRRTVEQVVAANVDTVFLVTAFGHDLNPRRLERYLTATWDSGASPVIVVNKADTAEALEGDLAEVDAVAMGVPVHAVSAVAGSGLESLEEYLVPGQTVALLGSSGVGKSTLVNRFAGRDVLATAEIGADGRGRHTTTHRELVPLPRGALLLDTPGMRELQLWASEESLAETFDDIVTLAEQCRFRDCAHDTEPGCAVRAALEAGTLAVERWESYVKLQRELRSLAIRQDARLRSEAKKDLVRWLKSREKLKY